MVTCYIRPIFSSGFDYANLAISFRGSKYLSKSKIKKCVFLFLKIIAFKMLYFNIFAY